MTISNEANEKNELIINDITIHSLKELRENFDSETILKAHINGTLYQWLQQHYYEKEADKIQYINIEQQDCLKQICLALGVSYIDVKVFTDEEKAAIEAKKKLVAQFTDDEAVLSEAWLVAMNQEELADLLNKNEKKIYLCKETFSVPIRIPSIEYIGIGNATIENAYTSEQYKKAGIKISGIKLADTINPDTVEIAKDAAKANGYDDFFETHSPLATVFHNMLKSYNIIKYYNLPCDYSVISNYYKSKLECMSVRDNSIRKAYDTATKYITTGNSKSFTKEAAIFYNNRIENVFSSSMEKLKSLSTITQTTTAYEKLDNLISKSYKNLLAKFEEEIQDNSDYYKMYDYSYFLEQCDIEKIDYRVSDGIISNMLEALFTDSIEYSINDISSSIHEMEKDLNEFANTFFTTAFNEYNDYVSDIEQQLDIIGKNLPAMQEKETIDEYLVRMCINKAM